MNSVVVLSGGMDSTTALYWARANNRNPVLAVSINYGQRHVRELLCAIQISRDLEIEHAKVNLSDLRGLLPGNALTDDEVMVPEGHYTHPSMKMTVVPNRNMILLSVAIAAAGSRGASKVIYGAHAGDHPIYPDCRPEFVEQLSKAAELSWTSPIKIEAPFIEMTKTDIVSIGEELGVPWLDTWSCYKGASEHCGKCATCVERREAFYLAGVDDPTEYKDKTPIEDVLEEMANAIES